MCSPSVAPQHQRATNTSARRRLQTAVNAGVAPLSARPLSLRRLHARTRANARPGGTAAERAMPPPIRSAALGMQVGSLPARWTRRLSNLHKPLLSAWWGTHGHAPRNSHRC